jgi:hypothetical protein
MCYSVHGYKRRKGQRMKKLAATLVMTGILAVAGFAAPANAAPKDKDTTTSSTSNSEVNYATIGWWPN